MEKITQKFIDDLRKTFVYRDGFLFRNNKQVGYFDKSTKYFRFKYKGKTYLLHRIIFAIHYGYLPDMVDHKDRNRENNKIENLRECKQRALNTVNSLVRKDSSSKFKGVAWHKGCNKWQSSVFKDGKRYYLGVYSNPQDAAKKYDEKVKELFGEFAVLNLENSL